MYSAYQPPVANCTLCPRLCAFREKNAQSFPHFFNSAVPSFGALDAPILLVGLAPGLKGANATGRPFTGDFAGDILYAALQSEGLATGNYAKRADDGFSLHKVRITNAVRCVPPENKPELSEIAQCNQFLKQEIAAMPKLKTILTLGNISHAAVIKALGGKVSAYKFAHGAEHEFKVSSKYLLVINSYHTSRYNIQTRRLSQEMFNHIIARVKMSVA